MEKFNRDQHTINQATKKPHVFFFFLQYFVARVKLNNTALLPPTGRNNHHILWHLTKTSPLVFIHSIVLLFILNQRDKHYNIRNKLRKFYILGEKKTDITKQTEKKK